MLLHDAAAELSAAAVAEQEQLDLLAEPITPEEAAVEQERLGPEAGPLTVLRAARETRKRGRTPGSKNRRTGDTVEYLSRFGPDPLVAAMQIIASSPEAMVERSASMDPVNRRLSWADAQAMRMRMIELTAPYWYGKQPVRVDATIRGVIVQEIFGGHEARGVTIDSEPVGVLPFDDEEGT